MIQLWHVFLGKFNHQPTNQPRQSCQGSQRLGYHLFGSSMGTSCWLACRSASKWKRFMCFHRAKNGGCHPIFTHGSLWKSSGFHRYFSIQGLLRILWLGDFFCIPDTIPLGLWNLFGTFCYPPGNCPRSHFWVDDFPAFPFGGIWTRKQIPSINVPCFWAPCDRTFLEKTATLEIVPTTLKGKLTWQWKKGTFWRCTVFPYGINMDAQSFSIALFVQNKV